MAVTGVMRPGHVALRVMEIEPAVKHYVEVVGLYETGRDDQGRVYLKAWDEHDAYSLVLIEADAPGMDHYAFKVLDTATMNDYAEKITAWGLTVERMPAGELHRTGERIRFVVPTGHHIELYAEKEQVGNGLPQVNPDVSPDDLHGMHPTRMDHCLVWGRDVDGSRRFFEEVLGFQTTEQIMTEEGENGELIGCFLTCSNKPHDIAFIKAEGDNWFHHISFNLESWEEIRNAADIISKRSLPIEYGPGRHGLTRGMTIYFFDPSGNRNEVFHGGYIAYPDMPILTWTAERADKGIFYYGQKMIESFMTAHT
ncbi:MAG: catechol 2,3-dioxygenase [Gammaproteobacteria bacterium]|nr:catechol 2,3-dioxygenase [Gammaproteobacteria bacterium]